MDSFPYKCVQNRADNIWCGILDEVYQRNIANMQKNKSILILGDYGVGKSTLMGILQEFSSPKNLDRCGNIKSKIIKGAKGVNEAAILKYDYITAPKDDMAHLEIWVLNTDNTNLLQYSLSKENYAYSHVVLTVSITEPWNWPSQLDKWMNVVAIHIESLKIEGLKEEEAQQHLEAKKQFCSPKIGLPITVVVTKTDYMTTLEQHHDFKPLHFYCIQDWIRRFCIENNAALIYTSVKANINCQLLYEHLTQGINGFDFIHLDPIYVEKDGIFIPTGWDTLNKVALLCGNVPSFKHTIRTPQSDNCTHDSDKECEIVTQDEQTFLSQQLAKLQKKEQFDEKSGLSSQVKDRNDSTPHSSTSPQSETVLARFFKKLMIKKSTITEHLK